MTSHKEKPSLKSRQNAVSRFMSKVFDFIKLVFHFVWDILRNCLGLVVFLFQLLIQLMTEPSFPCTVAIAFFVLVAAVAGYQWWQIGIWLASFAGVTGAWGIGAGVLGCSFGIGLNAFQLSSEMWKLRKDVAHAYTQLGIDTPNADIEKTSGKEASIKNLLANWFPQDHQVLRTGRLFSYSLETGLVLAYCFLGQSAAMLSIITAAVSLLLPETALKVVAATASLTREVSDAIDQNRNAENPRNVTF
jgi:hypothetical protein